MSNLRQIKRRIKSVDNISKVTHAMQLVAASRMKKAQQNAVNGQSYAEKIKDIMIRISTNKNIKGDPFIEPEYAIETPGVLFIVFSPERGLAGSLPGNLSRFVLRMIRSTEKNEPVQVLTVGKKVRDQLIRRDVNVVADFSDMPEQPTTADIRPIVRFIKEGYLNKEFGEVVMVYPKFLNALTQEPVAKVLLPLDLEKVHKYEDEYDEFVVSGSDFIFEPSREEILLQLIPGYLETQIYQARLETVASEYSARMIAMRNATTNARSVRLDLTLEYNKSRQAMITQELSEISAGRLGRS